jgi:uncharacterized membrane protein YecN with MAPEG domain
MHGDQSLGDNLSKEGSQLHLATCCHQHFIEDVPLAFVQAAIAELNGGDRKILTRLMSALFVFRVLTAMLVLTRSGVWASRWVL